MLLEHVETSKRCSKVARFSLEIQMRPTGSEQHICTVADGRPACGNCNGLEMQEAYLVAVGGVDLACSVKADRDGGQPKENLAMFMLTQPYQEIGTAIVIHGYGIEFRA